MYVLLPASRSYRARLQISLDAHAGDASHQPPSKCKQPGFTCAARLRSLHTLKTPLVFFTLSRVLRLHLTDTSPAAPWPIPCGPPVDPLADPLADPLWCVFPAGAQKSRRERAGGVRPISRAGGDDVFREALVSRVVSSLRRQNIDRRDVAQHWINEHFNR
eukprot:583744-Prorocentrum_minimum.AAC.1